MGVCGVPTQKKVFALAPNIPIVIVGRKILGSCLRIGYDSDR